MACQIEGVKGEIVLMTMKPSWSAWFDVRQKWVRRLLEKSPAHTIHMKECPNPEGEKLTGAQTFVQEFG
jgi:hypothetical protein